MSSIASANGRDRDIRNDVGALRGARDALDRDCDMTVSTISGGDEASSSHIFIICMFLKLREEKNYSELISSVQANIDDAVCVREGFVAIGDLSFDSAEAQDELGHHGVCGTIVFGMKMHPHSLGVALSGLTAITALLLRKNCENAERIVQAGGCDVIVSALRTHVTNFHVALGAALAIDRLLDGPYSAERSLLLRMSGVCEEMVPAIKHHLDNADVTQAFMRTATSLSNCDNINCNIFSGLGIFEIVISALQRHEHNVEITFICCLFLAVLTQRNYNQPIESFAKLAEDCKTLMNSITIFPHHRGIVLTAGSVLKKIVYPETLTDDGCVSDASSK